MNGPKASKDFDCFIDLYPDGLRPVDDDVELKPEAITPEKFMREVREIISFAFSWVTDEQRSELEAEGRLSSAGRNGIMLFRDWEYEEGDYKCGWKHDLIPLSDDSKAEMVVDLSLKGILPWQALTSSIDSYLRDGLALSPQYIDLIRDVLQGKISPPKNGRFKKYEVDYRAYMMAARDVSERFVLALTRNDVTGSSYSALDAIAEASGISYGTLKREAYQRHHKEY